MTVLCERKKMNRETLEAMKPYFLEWRRREQEMDMRMIEEIQDEEDAIEENISDDDDLDKRLKSKKDELKSVESQLKNMQKILQALQKEKNQLMDSFKLKTARKNPYARAPKQDKDTA